MKFSKKKICGLFVAVVMVIELDLNVEFKLGEASSQKDPMPSSMRFEPPAHSCREYLKVILMADG